MPFLKFELAALALTSAYGLKVGVISDMHTNMYYDDYGGEDADCWSTIPDIRSDKPSPWARYGCDPSADLVDAMLNRYIETLGSPDFLLITGDHVCHNMAKERGEATEESFQAVKDNLKFTNDIVKKYFSDIPVLTVFGNNDSKYHNQAPDTADKADFYGYVFDLWFTEMPGNARFAADDEIKRTFLSAGYYRADITDSLSVLVLNS